MKKILSVLLVLAMVLSMVPVSVTAAGTVEASPKAGTHQTTGHTCEDEGCGETNWLPWPTTGTLPTEGHYYLTQNMEQTQMVSVPAGKSLHLCLNGYVIKKTTTNRPFSVSAAGAELVITDCTAYTDDNGVYRAGAITGGVNTGDSGGGAVFVYADATLKLYDGIITGNTHQNDSAGGGAIALRKKDGSFTRGGKFCMYGGEITNNYSFKTNGTTPIYGGAIYANTGSEVEISGGKIAGNTGAHGGAIYATAATVSVKNAEITGNTGSSGNIALYKKSALTVENVTMTGNTATNGSAVYAEGSSTLLIKDCTITGNEGIEAREGKEKRSAAIYVVSATVTLSGKNVIADNITTAATVPDVVLDNDSYDTLYIKDLTDGSRVVFATPNTTPNTGEVKAEVIALNADKKQTDWQSGWVRYMAADGSLKDVGLVNEEFVWGHYHGTQAYTALEKADQLVAGGHYYLADNVTLDKEALVKTNTLDLSICLNGHSLTPASGSRILETGDHDIDRKIVIDDCTAYTDSKGEYHAGSITGANNTKEGGLFALRRGTTLELYEGKLTGNTGDSGGAIMLYGTFKMFGGEISNNKAYKDSKWRNGGAIYANSGSSVTITGGTIKGNEGNGGGAIYASADRTIELKDVTITGNKAHTYGGAIMTRAGCIVKVSGSTKISGNTLNDAENNLFIHENVEVVPTNLSSGAKIGINLYEKRIPGAMAFSAELPDGVDLSASFPSDDTKYKTELVNKKLTLVEDTTTPPPVTTHTHCVCGDTTCTQHQQVSYNPWTDSTKLPDSGNYCLMTDVTVEETINYAAGANKTLNLCLHGKTITQKAGTNVQMFHSKADANVTITISDCQASGSGDTYSAGKITGFTGPATGGTEGGVMYLRKGTTLNLYDGIISNNRTPAKSAGAIMMNGVFNMYGGQFVGNTAGKTGSLKNGGAVYLNSESVFTMTGGMFKNNTGANGGAIYCNHIPATISNAIFTGNVATQGGALCAVKDTALVLSNCTFSNNTAEDGGAVNAAGDSGATTTVRMENCTVTGNTATTGGSVYIKDYTDLTLAGKNTITGNQGGNLYLYSGRVFSLDNFSTESSIGVSAEDPGRAISTDCADFAANLTSDDADYKVTYKDGKLWLESSFQHTHCVCGDATCTQHGVVEYLPWRETDKLPSTAGNYCLLEDVTLTTVHNFKNDVTLCLHGHTITTTSTNKGLMSLPNADVTLTITDCTAKTENGVYTAGKLTGAVNEADGGGGAIFVRAGSTLKLYDGIITGNKTLRDGGGGGGVMLQSVKNDMIASFYMYGGEISGNSACSADGKADRSGGGVYAYRESVFVMEGGVIKDNEAGTGGGIYASNAHLTLGGEISGNKAATDGGVSMNNGTTLTVTGKAVITGNTAGSKASNLCLYGKQMIKAEKLDKAAKVAVSGQPLTFFTEKCDDYTANFLSDNTKYQVVYQDGAMYLDAAGNHKHCLCAATSTYCDHSVLTFVEWDDPTDLPTSGNYYLSVDVELPSQKYLEDTELNLCLNGHTIKITGEQTRAYYTKGDAILRITDCNEKPGVITGGTKAVIVTENEAESETLIELYNGILTGNENVSLGGAVQIQGGTTFNMYGGKITGNSLPCKLKLDENGKPALDAKGNQTYNSNRGGGAVGLYGKNTVFHMYGGEITGNKTTQVIYLNKSGEEEIAGGYGGGIFVEKGSVYIHGGLIANNTTDRTGGGLYNVGGLIEITGGEITKNTCATSGAGFYAYTNSTVNIHGGAISGNTSGGNAGGFYAYKGSKITMTGGKVSNNTSKSSGCGILLSGKGVEMNMTGGEVTGNRTEGSAGGILVQSRAVLHMKNVKVTKNYCKSNGAGVYISKNSSFTMEGGTISNNTAKSGTGGLHMAAKATGKITGGSVSYNQTEGPAGGVRLSGATLTASGLSIIGNTSAKSGCGLWVGGTTITENGVKNPAYSTVNLYGCTISNNTAEGSAAGILFQSKGTVANMSGCTVSGNKGTNSGGGLYASSNITLTIKNSKFIGNEAKNGAGMRINNCLLATLENVEVKDNTATSSGGGMYVGGSNLTAVLKDLDISGNSGTSAGGILVTSSAPNVKLLDSKIYNNTAYSTSAGGINIGSNSVVEASNLDIFGNKSETSAGGLYVGAGSTLVAENISVHENSTNGFGGGALLGGDVTLTNSTFTKNSAKDYGGGVATHTGGSRLTGLRAGAKLIDCQISGNTAGTMGGGLYVHRGGPAELTNVEITNNTSNMEGGGIYSDGKMKLADVSITDNTSGGTGYAVYLTPADSDGHTYYAGYKSIRGNMIIRDNTGGDVYLDSGIPLVVEGALGDDSVVQVTLSDGVLTQRVLGVYHYEGEGLSYTLTAGDRSITEPMAPEGDAEDTDGAAENVLLYVGIGVFVIAVAAVAVLLVLKKKKAGKSAEKVNKE